MELRCGRKAYAGAARTIIGKAEHSHRRDGQLEHRERPAAEPDFAGRRRADTTDNNLSVMPCNGRLHDAPASRFPVGKVGKDSQAQSTNGGDRSEHHQQGISADSTPHHKANASH
ncbi:hypothetical protein JCM13580A_62810 [Streptomyces drozdowiczii]